MIKNFENKYGKPNKTILVVGDYDKCEIVLKGRYINFININLWAVTIISLTIKQPQLLELLIFLIVELKVW